MTSVSPNGKRLRSSVLASATLDRTQEMVQPSRALLDAAKWALPMPLAVLDHDGLVVAANQAWRHFARDFGASPLATRRIGVNYVTVCDVATGPSAADANQAAAGIRAVLAGAQNEFTLQCSFLISPTKRRWFLLQVTPLPGVQGGVTLAFLDISERKHLEHGLYALTAIADAVIGSGGASDTSLTSVATEVGSPSLRRVAVVAQQTLGCEGALVAEVDATTGHLHPVIALGSQRIDEREPRTVGGRAWMGDFLPRKLSARLRAGEVVERERRESGRLGSTSVGRSRALLAPIRSGSDLIGVLALDYGTTAHSLTEAQCILASVTAHLVALELERERLLRERDSVWLHELDLEETIQRMDEYFAVAIHDLRSPLTAVVGGTDFAARQFERLARTVLDRVPELADQVEAVRRRMNDTELSMERLTRFVAVLFDTARVQSGALDLRRDLCDLVAIVREQVSSLRLAHPERKIRICVQPQAPIRVLADADRIGEVVANYLTNALKYSPSDRAVTVRVQVAGQWARVSVTDHGPGLPDGEKERIWKRFYRSANIQAQSGANCGLGLGLHICKIFIEAHGGQVGVESEVGQGSTFWFTVPLA